MRSVKTGLLPSPSVWFPSELASALRISHGVTYIMQIYLLWSSEYLLYLNIERAQIICTRYTNTPRDSRGLKIQDTLKDPLYSLTGCDFNGRKKSHRAPALNIPVYIDFRYHRTKHVLTCTTTMLFSKLISRFYIVFEDSFEPASEYTHINFTIGN